MAVRKGSILTVSIKPELAGTLRAQAEIEHRTISAIVTMALEAYLNAAQTAQPEPRRRLIRPV